LTNVVGTQNVISASIENSVEAVVFISTDKAVDPLNLYGITKSCAERLIIAANNVTEKTKFICIRGGNVLGTNGSIVPLFKEQIITKEKVTLTDDRMTRFFLNLDDAIKLIFKSLETSVGGETFVMKMPSAKIIDLANVMIEELSDKEIHIEKIGIRPGEKIHELLVSKYDSGRIIEEEEYFIILPLIEIPNLKDYYKNRIFKTEAEYSSDKARRLDMEEIKEMLRKDGWLDKKMEIELGEKKTIDLPKGVEYV
jgi:FlaA1/EpsC-like NDP-sugar epimerase